MNLRDRESPDRRGARREAAPRSESTGAGIRSLDLHAYNPGFSSAGRRSIPTRPRPPLLPMQVLKGQAVSPGIAMGPVVVLDPRGLRLPPRLITPEAVASELERLDRGLDAAKERGQPGRNRGPNAGSAPSTPTSWRLIAG